MKFKFLFLSLVFALIYSCNSDKKEKKGNQEVVIPVTKYETFFDDNNVIQFPANIQIHDSIMVVQELEGTEHFVFINLNNHSLIRKWGTKGRGPSEFNSIMSFSIDEGMLYFNDLNQKIIYSVPVHEIINNEVPEVTMSKHPYTVDFRPSSFFAHNGKIIALGSFQEGRMGMMDHENNIIGTYGNYPFNESVNERFNDLHKGTVYQGFIGVNPVDNKFCVINFESDAFEIYQVKDSIIESLFISDFSFPPAVADRGRNLYTTDSEKSIAGYRDISTSKDNIYLSFSDKNSKDFHLNELGSQRILVFDWNGNKKSEYILPQKVSQIAVAENHIYGVNFSEETGKTSILKFNIRP